MTDERGGKLSELHRKQETWPNRRDGTFQPARSIVTLKKKKEREKHNHLNMLDPRLTVWTSQRGPKQPTVGKWAHLLSCQVWWITSGIKGEATAKLVTSASFPTSTVSGGKRCYAALKLSVVLQVACSLKAASQPGDHQVMFVFLLSYFNGISHTPCKNPHKGHKHTGLATRMFKIIA